MHPDQFRILYVGRKAQIFDQLQTLFEAHNQIINKQTAPGQPTQRTGAREGSRDGASATLALPAVAFEIATNQKNALHHMRLQPPTAILVEIEQKRASRIRFCEIVRYRLPMVAILAITSRQSQETFPFDGFIELPLVTEKVIKSLKQLGRKQNEHQLHCGPIHLDMATRTVTTLKGQYAMTPKQCALLKLLMQHEGNVVERRLIMETVWETSYLEDTRTLDVHVRWLREHIEQDPSKPLYLKTIRSVGYRFQVS